MNNTPDHTVTNVGKLITQKEAKKITEFVIEQEGAASKEELKNKIKTLLQFIQNARMSKSYVYLANMALRGKIPKFIEKKKILGKTTYTLDWSEYGI